MSGDDFTYPYPLEADDPGDATKFTANLQALVDRINSNAQTGKAFALAYRQVYVGTTKFYSNITGQLLSWDMARSGTIESAGIYFHVSWVNITAHMQVYNETTNHELGYWICQASPPIMGNFKLKNTMVAKDDKVSIRAYAAIEDWEFVPIDGLQMTAWLVLRCAVEV